MPLEMRLSPGGFQLEMAMQMSDSMNGKRGHQKNKPTD
jgi:hypothetical protein